MRSLFKKKPKPRTDELPKADIQHPNSSEHPNSKYDHTHVWKDLLLIGIGDICGGKRSDVISTTEIFGTGSSSPCTYAVPYASDFEAVPNVVFWDGHIHQGRRRTLTLVVVLFFLLAFLVLVTQFLP